MPWSRSKLDQVAGHRRAQRAQLQPVEKAALAYARWQGLTDEDGVDTDAAKRALDAALDDLYEKGPEAWCGLEQLSSDLGDPAIIGLMQYSLRHSAEQVREQATGEPEADGEPVATARRRRRRDRGM